MRKAFFQLHAAVFLAGFTGILGRLITLNEGVLVWYRMLFAGFTLWIISLFQSNSKIQPISRGDLFKIIGIGGIVALHWVTFYGSIKYSNVSIALVCFSAIGFFTALIEPMVTKKPVNKIELLLGLLVIAGIYLIFHFDPAYKTGIIIGLISALLASLFPVLNRQLVQRIDSKTITLYEITGGFLFLSVFLPFYLDYFPANSLVPTWSDIGWLLVLSWFCTVLSFNLSMNALKKISAFTVNLTYNLEPVYGIALAFIVYREDQLLTLAFYAGLSLIALSVFLQTWFVYRAQMKERLSQ